MSDTDLLPAMPERDVTEEMLAEAESLVEDGGYPFGMWSAVGAARVSLLVAQVEAALAAGLGREVALAVLRGGCVRLERDGLREYSDTVVRESIGAALEAAFESAGVHAPTDDEIGEVALLLSLRSLTAMGDGFLKGAAHSAR